VPHVAQEWLPNARVPVPPRSGAESGTEDKRRLRRCSGMVSTKVTSSRAERSSAIQVLRGAMWTGAGLLGLASFAYGAGIALLGGDVGTVMLTHGAVRGLGLLLVVAALNVERAVVKQESVVRALALDAIGLVGVVAVLWILVAPK